MTKKQKFTRLLITPFILAMATSCSHSIRSIASIKSTDQNGNELAKEVIPANEAASTKEIISIIQSGYAHYKPKDLKPAAHRIIHGKQHGCVKAVFEIKNDLPEEFRYGVFAKSGTYPSWIRFSNGSGAPQHDGVPDARGLAIKLMEVEGQKLADELHTQDFLLQSSPIFFVSDVEAYIKFMKVAAHPGPAGIGELIKSIKINDPRDRKSLEAVAFESAALIENPLTANYYSALPQKLGPNAMKLQARTCPNTNTNLKKFNNKLDSNFLENAMNDELSNNGACIELAAQIQNDAVAMPIEDAMVKWDQSKAPFVTVALIKIPKQSFISKQRMEFCENLSFNPWHSIEEHRPLGGLNRVRRVVYEQSSELRHNLNKQVSEEPNPATLGE